MATIQEISDELGALAGHYFRVVRTPEQHARWIMDYAEDLKDFPAEAIHEACAEWRRSDATKFPLLGQLLPVVRKYVATPEGGWTPRPWMPATEEEYRAMSLREKARECGLLGRFAKDTAHREALKAGWDRNIANAPEEFTFWMTRAEGHFAEQKRLRAKLAEYGDAA